MDVDVVEAMDVVVAEEEAFEEKMEGRGMVVRRTGKARRMAKSSTLGEYRFARKITSADFSKDEEDISRHVSPV